MRRTGVLTFLLLLLTQHSLSAPQTTGSQREESAEAPPLLTLANPFGPGEDSRRLLQSYIQANVKEDQGQPDINTWEQEVFFLFSLHDYDRSGHLDGLEMMKFISDFNSHNAPGPQSAEAVVSVVDLLLQTQDVNQDGLFAPSELLSPPMAPRDSDSHDAPHQEEQEVGVASDGQLSEPGAQEPPQQKEHVETRVEGEMEEERKGEEDDRREEQDRPTQKEERKEPPNPEAPAAERGQRNLAPAHQGQAEM